MYGTLDKASDKLDEYITIYIKPIYDTSEILSEYNKIRASPALNQLIFDNIKALEVIFGLYQSKDQKNQFTKLTAHTMFGSLNSANYVYKQSVVE